MPAELQVKLLRVLETASAEPRRRQRTDQGRRARDRGDEPAPEEAVAAGKLREDLLYRLNVFPIELPPLRERRDDIELLAEHFLDQLNKEEGTSKRFTGAALLRLRAHSLAGQRARAAETSSSAPTSWPRSDIGLDTLPLGVAEDTAARRASMLKVGTSIAEAERRLILATLEHFEGDKKKTAAMLRISLKTLYNRLNVYHAGG